MPDPSFWGWIAAGAVGGAFMWLLKVFLTHLEKDIEYSRSTAKRGVETAEKATTIAEQSGR